MLWWAACCRPASQPALEKHATPLLLPRSPLNMHDFIDSQQRPRYLTVHLQLLSGQCAVIMGPENFWVTVACTIVDIDSECVICGRHDGDSVGWISDRKDEMRPGSQPHSRQPFFLLPLVLLLVLDARRKTDHHWSYRPRSFPASRLPSRTTPWLPRAGDRLICEPSQTPGALLSCLGSTYLL